MALLKKNIGSSNEEQPDSLNNISNSGRFHMSFGLLILIAACVWALVELLLSVLYFFK